MAWGKGGENSSFLLYLVSFCEFLWQKVWFVFAKFARNEKEDRELGRGGPFGFWGWVWNGFGLSILITMKSRGG